MLYDFQHSLTKTKIYFSLASKILLKCSKGQNSWMLWWLPGQLAVGVRVFCWKDTQLWYLDVQDKDPENPGILRVQGWPWCLILGLRYSLQFILHSHGLLPHHRLKIISVCHFTATHTHTHTQSTSYLFEEWVMTAFLTFALDEGSLHCVYTITAPNCSRAFSKRVNTFHFFYPYTFHQHIHHPFVT